MVPLKSWPGIGLVLVVTFGLSALTAVLSLGALPAVIAIAGWLIVAPALAILTYYDDSDADTEEEAGDPVSTLRQRYAQGELSESEFERRLDRLLETEEAEQPSDRDRERTVLKER
ncbi:SHOCT domain-containing protein [Halolamina salifodinae]|uniref:Putative membrane protein n=1 Tax=Halolamina salifodinae TaxID=1202767 RepID=A0A8T4GUJ7_9EURY|nr:SHOCT domain-containing protein [Halolamina salifodinae]MBP1986070.1 putative membrane protein [Halolamina salifodinae]